MRSAVLWVVVLASTSIGYAAAQTRPYFDIPEPNVRDHVFASDGQLFLALPASVKQVDTFSCRVVSQIPLGTDLTTIDVTQSGRRLAIGDRAANGNTAYVHLIERPEYYIGAGWLDPQGVSEWGYKTASTLERGSWSVVWQDESSFVFSGTFAGSGWTPLREADLLVGDGKTWGSVRQQTMIAKGGSVIFTAEANISSGPVTAWRDGQKLGDFRTQWFVWELAARRDGSQVMVPTYNGAYVLDFAKGKFVPRGRIGVYADNGPIGGAYSADGALLFTASWSWASPALSGVRVYDSVTLELVEAMDQVPFTSAGNYYRGPGRVKISPDGMWLAVTLPDRVRVYDVSGIVSPGSTPRALCQGWTGPR